MHYCTLKKLAVSSFADIMKIAITLIKPQRLEKPLQDLIIIKRIINYALK